jgi:hypothetical protein
VCEPNQSRCAWIKFADDFSIAKLFKKLIDVLKFGIGNSFKTHS